ncbi:MAG: hypothetical protein KatS3mg121_0415 [Gammaproteobacteria bacterium]|nr:MAG: hypothetical protein KatS3mg121_0415 [Gammaproteobacteria bacterium]
MIENPKVKKNFLPVLESALNDKGVRFRVIGAGQDASECRWVLAYTAHWRWDLRLYMAYAEIVVKRDGLVQGRAVYDSTRGGANPAKFINAEKKIRELVDQLFQVQANGRFLLRFAGVAGAGRG